MVGIREGRDIYLLLPFSKGGGGGGVVEEDLKCKFWKLISQEVKWWPTVHTTDVQGDWPREEFHVELSGRLTSACDRVAVR